MGSKYANLIPICSETFVSKIAIIGSGIAGLAAARNFKLQGHHVTLFEKQATPGMAAHGFEIHVDGQQIRGDLPSRMFNRELWPNVARLYDDLNIGYEKVAAKQHFFDRASGRAFPFELPVDWRMKLGVATGLGTSPMLKQLQRLQQQAAKDLANGTVSGDFAQYLSHHGFSEEFSREFLFPALSATVCTCSDQAIGQYPAAILLDAMQKIASDDGLWRVSNGSTAVVSALVAYVDDDRCSTEVNSILEGTDAITVSSGGSEDRFDRVIVATQANHVAALCPTLPKDILAVMNSFEYEDVVVAVHTDQRFMPEHKRDWSVFNFETSSAGSMCTVWLNKFHTQWPVVTPVFQTIKPLADPSPETVVCSVNLQRPVVTTASKGLWDAIDRINQGDSRIKFCGAYAVPGIPLLESALLSAHRLIHTD